VKPLVILCSLIVLVLVTVARAGDVPDERVLVVGQQPKVTEIPYASGMTVSKAVIASGGYGDFSRTPFYLVRCGQVTKIDLEAALIRGEREKDIALKPWDIIVVGRNLRSR
jgi:protein involved in polysaccharide export with SLBB domain